MSPTATEIIKEIDELNQSTGKVLDKIRQQAIRQLKLEGYLFSENSNSFVEKNKLV